MKKNIKEIINKKINNYANLKNIDFEEILEDVENLEELEEKVQEAILEQEVIYSSNAIDYLSKNDPSLTYSLELADDLGYNLKNINSEILATLLLQDNLQDEWRELKEEIKQAL